MRLERAMMRVRWFGIVFGLYQVFSYVPNPGTVAPRSTVPLALGGLGLLLGANAVVLAARRTQVSVERLRTLGWWVFLVDVAAVWMIVWAYTFEEFGTTWVIITVLCLEGALRAQQRGAMLPVLLAIPIESVREVVRFDSFADLRALGVGSAVSSVTFRVGIFFMIGAVAGAIARNLEHERAEAERRADERTKLAEREAAARAESSAFQQVILAGVRAAGLEESLQSMIDSIAIELGYERLAVLMVNDVDPRTMSVVALHGFPGVSTGENVPEAQGIAGAVLSSGSPEVIADVRADTRYHLVDPSTLSQITLPIRVGDRIIGVLDVEASVLDAFDQPDLARLERLCNQMGLVIQNARLLAAERATVERLRDLDTMKSDFVAIASHELRTPLTAIQGSIKTLRRAKDTFEPAQSEELLAIIDRQADRLTRLVEDLLLASRIDSGRVQLRMDSVDLGDTLRETLDELGARADRVSLAVAPTLPRLITDGQRIGQIARNLIENALKFSPEGSPVRVTAHHSSEGLVLEVADDGPGIPPDEIPHIFERFHQIGGSLRRRGEGFGLGLYITQRLAEALGGRIEVDSKLGRGTTFRVYVPVAAADLPGSSEIA
jgi:signal transduction histidine kinase